jgi:NTE family protein
MKPRIGLALSGGGSKGAFTVGVLQVIDQLLDPMPYPVISGTSTGSLVGTLLATGQFARLVEIYSTVQTKNIINPRYAFVGDLFGAAGTLVATALLGGRALYDQSALAATIAANVDFQRILTLAERTRLIYSTVDLQSGKLVTFNNRDHSARQLADGLLASTSIPVLMNPVSIRSAGKTSAYIDGGVREFLPLRAVFDSGIELDHIIAISTAPLEPKHKPSAFNKLLQIFGRTIDLLNSEVARNDYFGALHYNALLRLVENAEANGLSRAQILRGIPQPIRRRLTGKRSIPVTFIGPNRHIEMNALEFDPATMRQVMNDGVKVAKRIVPKIVAELASNQET